MMDVFFPGLGEKTVKNLPTLKDVCGVAEVHDVVAFVGKQLVGCQSSS